MRWVESKESSITFSAVAFLLLAILSLPLQQPVEGPVLLSSKITGSHVKAKPAPLASPKLGILFPADRPDQTPNIHPSLLRIDRKQNLLVWPNIARHLTRSPPPSLL
jgi:hypothetical protein